MPSPRQLQHFIAAFEQRTLLGASRVVNLSQPALSKSILALEQEYSVKLFDRHPRGLVPTTHGHALEHHARRILLDLNQSKLDLEAISSGATGRVRVGVGQSFVKTVETALIKLEEAAPGTNNTVITDYAEGLRQALLENRVDLVLGMVNRLAAEKEFESQIWASDPIVGLCHKHHEFAKRQVSLQELHDHDWLMPERGEVARSSLEAFFLLNQQPLPRFKIITNIPAIVGRYVQDFRLLSLAPRGSLPEYEGFDTTWFEIKNFHFERQIGIVRRAGIATTPLTQKFEVILHDLVINDYPKDDA